MKQRVFGDKERVLVDGEPGTVIDSPIKDGYVVELDSGNAIERMGSTIQPLQESVTSASKLMDWYQVVLNGGPPCFFFQEGNGRFCGRAQRWPGHDEHHKFVSLSDLLEMCFKND